MIRVSIRSATRLSKQLIRRREYAIVGIHHVDERAVIVTAITEQGGSGRMGRDFSSASDPWSGLRTRYANTNPTNHEETGMTPLIADDLNNIGQEEDNGQQRTTRHEEVTEQFRESSKASMLNMTERILSSNGESLITESSEDVEHLLEWHCSTHTRNGVGLAFDILEKLLQHHLDSSLSSTPSSPRITHRMLPLVIEPCLETVMECKDARFLVQRAEYMIELFEQVGMAPSILQYNAVMKMLYSIIKHPKRIENIIERLRNGRKRGYGRNGHNQIPKPNSISYTIWMDAWYRGFAADKMEQIIRQMTSEYRQALMAGNEVAALRVKPNKENFKNAIHARARQTPGKKEEPEKAEELLILMQKLHDERTDLLDNSLRPDVMCFTAVVNGWANGATLQASENADATLRLMQELYDSGSNPEVEPNIITYNTVIRAWSLSRYEQAGSRAEALLRQMYDRAKEAQRGPPDETKSRPPMPNKATYIYVLNAWRHHENGGEKAEALLEEMMELSKTDTEFRPSAWVYNSAIRAIATSDARNKAARSAAILNSAHKPDRDTYQEVLRACALEMCNSEGSSRRIGKEERQSALLVTTQIITQMRQQGVKPSSMIMKNFFTAVGTLAANGSIEQDKLFWAGFAISCENNIWNHEDIQDAVKKYASNTFYKQLTQAGLKYKKK
eukprot:scaffold278418_cov53-Attheya_sp.AAC.4